MPKTLSVIISNRNDVVMLSVTIRSCLEAFKALNCDCEIVICDNSDNKIYPLLSGAIPPKYIKDGLIKIYRQDFPCLFTARETAATKATGRYILCLDSHMLIGHNTFRDLVDFMNSRKSDSTLGFAHAPISWCHQHESRSKHDRDISHHELGPWGTSYTHARTITWKGMPWICRREWFLNQLRGYGALAQHRISWGGGDMHIGVKPWLLGYKNWAVPCNPCIHIGPFPKIDLSDSNPGETKVVLDALSPDRYRRYATSGNYPHTFGFLVSCYVLGGEPMIDRNKEALQQRFGRYINIEESIPEAIKLGQSERDWLLANQKLSFEDFLTTKPWELSN